MGFIDRDIVITFIVGIAIGIGGTLLLNGDDSSDPSPQAAVETPTTSTQDEEDTGAAPPNDALTGVGEQAKSGGIALRVSDAHTEPSVTYVGNVCSQITPDCTSKTESAPQGGAYVYVDTVVTNDTSKGIDITCSLPIDAKLVDDTGRKFDPIEGLDQLQGNPECNSLLQPGFDADMTWVFLIPPDAEASAFEFSDFTNLSKPSKPARVSLPNL